MAREIERKFLIVSDDWRAAATPPVRLQQGYLALDGRAVVRVRISGDDHAFVTVKSNEPGIARDEFEYEVPVADAQAMMKLSATPPIDKRRYKVTVDGMVWEIDEFAGANAGLLVAEIELPAEDAPFTKPSWAGRDVTEDPRYFNAALARKPFSSWGRT